MTDETPPDQPTGGTESSLPHRFGANVFSNYMALGVTAVSAIVVTPLLLHHLGRPAFGVWVLATTVVAYLELFELGFGGATTKLVAEDAHVRPDQAVRMINTTFFVLVPMGIIALGVGVVVAFLFPGIVHVASGLHDQVIVCVAVLAVGLAVSIPGDTFGGSLMGHQRFDLLSMSNAADGHRHRRGQRRHRPAGRGDRPAGHRHHRHLGAPSKACGGPWSATSSPRPGSVPGSSTGSGCGPRPTSRAGSCSRPSSRPPSMACDVVIVGIVLGVRPAAVYAVGAKLAKAANQSMDSLAVVFFPYASATVRNRDGGDLKDIVIDGVRVTLLVGVLIALLLMVLAGPGITGLGGTRATTPRPMSSSSWPWPWAWPHRCGASARSSSGRAT